MSSKIHSECTFLAFFINIVQEVLQFCFCICHQKSVILESYVKIVLAIYKCGDKMHPNLRHYIISIFPFCSEMGSKSTFWIFTVSDGFSDEILKMSIIRVEGHSLKDRRNIFDNYLFYLNLLLSLDSPVKNSVILSMFMISVVSRFSQFAVYNSTFHWFRI